MTSYSVVGDSADALSAVRQTVSECGVRRRTASNSPASLHGDLDKLDDTLYSRKQKIVSIRRSLKTSPDDIARLKQFAIKRGGLVNNDLRRKAWPKLLNVSVSEIPPRPDRDEMTSHRDYDQVVMDVNRSFKRFPPGMKEEQRLRLQDQMVDIIMHVLVRHPELYYYQGYHDICVTFLLVTGEDVTFALIDKLSMNHLRDFLDVNMDRTKHILNYLFPIIGKDNPELRDFMEQSEVGNVFSISWLITWYGHVLNNFRHIVRLYDFFLACHPLMPIYLAAAIVLYRAPEILKTECEMCMVHSLLSKVPDDLPFEDLVSKAGDLYLQYPPAELANEAIINAMKSQEQQQTYLKLQSMQQNRNKTLLAAKKNGNRRFLVRMTVWTLTAALGAVAIAVINSAADLGWF